MYAISRFDGKFVGVVIEATACLLVKSGLIDIVLFWFAANTASPSIVNVTTSLVVIDVNWSNFAVTMLVKPIIELSLVEINLLLNLFVSNCIDIVAVAIELSGLV